jgi:hypothetical protein
MTTDRDTTTRVVRSWLRTDEHESADRVLDAALDLIDTTPQRRATAWPVRRLPEMNNTARLAMAAAAAVVVALLGIGLLMPGGPNFGESPDPTPTPAPSPTPTALRASEGEEELEPGTYVSHPLVTNPALAVTFTVPAGWQASSDSGVVPVGDSSTAGPDGMALGFLEISGLYSDPCDSAGLPDVDAGTTAEDLAAAFMAQTAYETTVEDVTLAGYSGKQVELQLPSAFEGSCPRDQYFVFDTGPYAQGLDNRWHLTILDVEGSRLVIFTEDFAASPANGRADLQSMIDSVSIDPGS